MDDLISRQAAIRKLKKMATQAYIDKLNGSAETVINCCIDVIERQIPSAHLRSSTAGNVSIIEEITLGAITVCGKNMDTDGD